MSQQEKVYLDLEANAFFLRNINKIDLRNKGIRSSKEDILSNILSYVGPSINGLDVLEVGCFIGDLLGKLKNDFQCKVVGIEPSSLACQYSLKEFGLHLVNNTYDRTDYFSLRQSNRHAFDIIVVDDVLSWMSREIILPVLASLDWLLKPGGIIYIRDFCPPVDFAFPNHHQPDSDVYNYKVSGGHKKFFICTGHYLIAQEYIRSSQEFQVVTTSRPDSSIWSDAILLKTKDPLHPRLKMD